MSDLFGFMSMADNYEGRKVARYDKDGVFVDTALVTDATQPYETAVQHPSYNDNKLIIVELYDTKEEAKEGHNRWVKTMTSDELPDKIKDVSTASVIEFGESIFPGKFAGREHQAKTAL